MPAIDDFSEEDDQKPDVGAGSGGARGFGGGSSAQLGNASPQQESSFVPWSRFVDANKSVSDREAGKLQSQVQGDINTATSGRDAASAAQSDDIKKNYQGYGQVVGTPPARKGPNGTPQFGGDTMSSGSSFGQTPGSMFSMAPQADDSQQHQSNRQAPGPNAKESRLGSSGLPSFGYAAGMVDPDKLDTSIENGVSTTTPGKLSGAKDLEGQLGKDAWSKLLGDTTKASSEANALGSETGVQGLLQKQAAAPLAQGGAFDAALLTGAGGQDFQQTARQGASLGKDLLGANQSAQDRWKKLMGDAGRASAGRDKEIAAATAAMNKTAAAQSAYDPATDDHLNHSVDELRTSINNGWIKEASMLGALDPQGNPLPGNLSGMAAYLNGGKMDGKDFNTNDAEGNMVGQYKQQADAAMEALGLTPEQLSEDVNKMSARELTDFFALGVIPRWMGGKGEPGEWTPPFAESAAGFGEDGGMWKAITDEWKEGATEMLSAAGGGPVGIVVVGGKAAYKGATAGPGKYK